jgi:hypothetical protein
MIRASNNADPAYVRDKAFLDEARECSMWFSPGANKAGLTDPRDMAQLESFLGKMNHATGKPLGRVQKNRDVKLNELLVITDHSINAFYEKLSEADAKKFWSKCWEPAIERAMHYMDASVPLRAGAGGSKSLKGESIAASFGNDRSREGHTLVHGHIYFTKYGMDSTGKERKAHEKAFFANRDGFDQVFQFNLAKNVENEFRLKCGYDVGPGVCYIHGYPRKPSHTTQNEKAKATLKAQGRKVTRASMAYTRQNIRQKKKPYAKKPRPAKSTFSQSAQPAPDRSWWQKVYDDFIKGPFKVYKAAYEASKKQPDAKIVNDPDKFILDAAPRTLMQRHDAAVKAIKKTKCLSLDHALAVAKQAFKDAKKPKIQWAKGTEVHVKGSAITSQKQLRRMQDVCTLRGFTLVIEGNVKAHQNQNQQQQTSGRKHP